MCQELRLMAWLVATDTPWQRKAVPYLVTKVPCVPGMGLALSIGRKERKRRWHYRKINAPIAKDNWD